MCKFVLPFAALVLPPISANAQTSAMDYQRQLLAANQGNACEYSNPPIFAVVNPSLSMPVSMPAMATFLGSPKRLEPDGCRYFVNPPSGGVTNAVTYSNSDYATRVVMEANLAKGITVAVRQRCISGCANEIMRLIKKGLKVCVTPNATFEFHPTLHREIDLFHSGPDYVNVYLSETDTNERVNAFPLSVQNWLRSTGVMDVTRNPIGNHFAVMPASYAVSYGLAHECSAQEIELAEMEINQFRK